MSSATAPKTSHHSVVVVLSAAGRGTGGVGAGKGATAPMWTPDALVGAGVVTDADGATVARR